VTAPWWAAFGPADTTVRCGGASHRVEWAGGGLHAVEHPDAEGELVLAALGGASTPCLDLVRSWGRHSDDLSALAIGPRAPGDELTLTAAALAEIRSARVGPGWSGMSPGGTMALRRAAVTRAVTGVSGSSSVFGRMPGGGRAAGRPRSRPRMGFPGPGNDESLAELLELLALGPAFQFRLCGAVADAWCAEGHQARSRRAVPALTAALAGRAAPAVGRWLGIDPGQVDAGLHTGEGWGEVRLAPAAGARRVHVRLPVSWLASVWAPGLAEVGGRMVVGVIDAAFPVARVLALATPAAAVAELTMRHDGERWSASA